MSKKILVLFALSLFYFSATTFGADESQRINETLLKVSKLKEKNEYDEIIKLIDNEINNGKLIQIYFDILGGAYAAKKNSEEAYLAYLKGHLYNPTTEYSRDNLVKKMNYIQNRAEELEKNSWLTKYLIVKKLFDDGDIANADKKISELSSEGKNLDVLCIINKDIKSFKSVSKETNSILGALNEAESMFNKVIAQLGDKCPEYVFYEFADLFYKTNKYDSALSNYQLSFKKNPSRRDNMLKIGVCQLYIKNYVDAKKQFLLCIEKYHEYSEAFLYLGFSQWALKESEKAIKSFSTVIELNKSNNSSTKEKAKKAISVVKRGDLFLTPSDMDKIIKATQPDTSQKKSTPENKGNDEKDQPADKK